MVVLRFSQIMYYGRGPTPPTNLSSCLVFSASERHRLQNRISELHQEKQQEAKNFRCKSYQLTTLSFSVDVYIRMYVYMSSTCVRMYVSSEPRYSYIPLGPYLETVCVVDRGLCYRDVLRLQCNYSGQRH